MASCSPGPARISNAAAELHGVTVYEGVDEAEDAYIECRNKCLASGNRKYPECDKSCKPSGQEGYAAPYADIAIDRPGRQITLVIGSYDQLEWHLEVSPKTQISKIVLLGYEGHEGSVTINGKPYTDIVRRADLDAPSSLNEPAFRRLAGPVAAEYGFERFTSFQARYGAPEDGFTILSTDSDTPELEPDYLRHLVKPVSPDDPLLMEGIIGGRTGVYKTDGTLVSDTSLISSSTTAIVPELDRAFIWGGKQIKLVQISTNETERLIDPPRQDKGIGRFRTFTFDPVRNRLVAIFRSGAAPAWVMGYDLDGDDWYKMAEIEAFGPNSIRYDAARDRFLVSGTSFSDKALIGELTPDGYFWLVHKLDADQLSGITDLFDPENDPMVNMYLVGLDGDRVVLAASGDSLFTRRQSPSLVRVYVVNYRSGTADLTYYAPYLPIDPDD